MLKPADDPTWAGAAPDIVAVAPAFMLAAFAAIAAEALPGVADTATRPLDMLIWTLDPFELWIETDWAAAPPLA
jgi:hypothetical protein